MKIVVALAVGYVVGARIGSKDLDQLQEALAALRSSNELADVIAAARAHAGRTLRELGTVVEGADGGQGDEAADLVDRVKQMFADR